MNRRYYRQYDDFGEMINPEMPTGAEKEKASLTGIPKTAASLDMPSFVQIKEKTEEPIKISSGELHKTTSKGLLDFGGIFDNIETEDIIIVAMIFMLLMEPEQDSMLILLLAFLFLSKFI